MSKNSMLKKDFKMNLAVARPAVKPGNKPTVAEVVVMLVSPGKCTRQYVQTAVAKPKYHSNHLATNRYIAAIVTRQCAATKIKNKDRS